MHTDSVFYNSAATLKRSPSFFIPLLATLLIASPVLWGCQSPSDSGEPGRNTQPTYDRDQPALSMQSMSETLGPEQEEQFIQAIGVLVGEFAFRSMAGDVSATDPALNPVLEERLQQMDGMTADEIIDYAKEIQAARLNPENDSEDSM